MAVLVDPWRPFLGDNPSTHGFHTFYDLGEFVEVE
jgi:hypothetical protein